MLIELNELDAVVDAALRAPVRARARTGVGVCGWSPQARRQARRGEGAMGSSKDKALGKLLVEGARARARAQRDAAHMPAPWPARRPTCHWFIPPLARTRQPTGIRSARNLPSCARAAC